MTSEGGIYGGPIVVHNRSHRHLISRGASDLLRLMLLSDSIISILILLILLILQSCNIAGVGHSDRMVCISFTKFIVFNNAT